MSRVLTVLTGRRRDRGAMPLAILAVWCVVQTSLPVLGGTPVDQSTPTAYRVAKVITMDPADTVVNNAVVLVKDGKIERVARQADVAIPEGYRVVDATDKWLFPGIVDAHTHVVADYNAWYLDLNDMVYLTNPGLRTVDVIVPENDMLKDARAGGVTTALMIPGSGTNLAGFGTVAKTAGKNVDEMVMRAPGTLKIAQAGNPEWYWYGVGRSFMNFNLRQTLQKARAYHEACTAYEKGEAPKPPAYDPLFHDFRGVFRREYPTSVHTQIYQVVMMTIDMLANEFNLVTMLDHSTFDAFKTAPLAVEAGVYTINGPRQYWFDFTQRKIHGNAARWWQGGVKKLGVNTDAPVVPLHQLPYQAAMACWYGWKPYPALRGITRITAESLLVDEQVGSIEPGKDADFGIWTGDPIDPRSSCEITVINGKIVYDANVKRRF